MTEKEIEILKQYTDKGRMKADEILIIRHLEKMGLMKINSFHDPSLTKLGKHDVVQYATVTELGLSILNSLPPPKSIFHRIIDRIIGLIKR